MVDPVIRVQTGTFDPGELLNELSGVDEASGAVASFVGQVRGGEGFLALELEHYPGVTEAALRRIADHAMQRWSLQRAMIIHRVGRMPVNDPIVFVGASSSHRRASLEGVAFMIDVLKTQAPFWKKEHTTDGSAWVEPRDDDDAAAAAWLTQDEEIPR